MKTIIFGAGSDLGVHIDGAHLGPVQLMNDLKDFYKGESLQFTQDANILKSRNLSDRRKNEYEVEKFNTNLYKSMTEKIKDAYFPILIGGDASVSTASALASAKINPDIGIIWISSHANYNTFESTTTGNLHGLALATINGYNQEMAVYHDGKPIQTSRTVIVGARNIESREKEILKYSGVTVFSTEDILEKGVETIMEEAFNIAGFKTKGIHICYSLDILDPDISSGVSVPEFDGLTEDDIMKINEQIIKHMKEVISYDLVEFNPLRDSNRKTEQIALNLLAQMIRAADNKGKFVKTVY